MKIWGKYIKPYWKYFVLGPICMVVEVIGEMLMPRLMGIIITNGTKGTLSVSSSIWTMIAMIGIALLMMGGGIGGAYFGAKASVNFATDLREDAFRAVQNYSFSNIDKFSSSSLITRMTNDVTQVQNFVNMLLRMALRAPGMLIAALIMSIILSPPLSVVFAVTIPLMVLAISGLIIVGYGRFTKQQTKIDALNATVQENITNVRVVKSFVRQEQEIGKFHKSNKELKESSFNAIKVMIFMEPVTSLVMYGTTLVVIWLGSKFVLNSQMDVGDLSSFIMYVTQILFSLMMVTFLFMFSARAIASAKRIKEVICEPLDISDENAKEKDKLVTDGTIEFKNVFFKYYKNREEYAIKDLSFSVKKGTTLGIIGSTGSGKSTLISMISRLYDPDEGSVYVDGVNVKDYSLKNLREGVGVVLQKNTLFSGTIKDNLRWGNENASDEELVQVCKWAQADKFITSFPDAYDTVIDQGGTNVSGGQKQRLCIARAMLKRPKVLILDDSTSAVDTATERQIRSALKKDFKDTTKIIIAQRITSVMEADQILVLNEGVITGLGTHEQLLETNEEYREIYDSQMGNNKGGANNEKNA